MMEKYGQPGKDIIDGLRIEEAELMGQIARLMAQGEKTASAAQEVSRLEMRLQNVRSKITAIDLGR